MRSQDLKHWLGKLYMEIYISLIVDKESWIFNAGRSTSFRILCRVLVTYTRTLNRTMHVNKDWRRTTGIRVEYFRRIQFVAAQWRSQKSLLLRFGETPENFSGKIVFMSMSDDISCGSRDNKVECMSNANLFALYAKDLGKDNGRLLVLVLKSNGTLSRNIVHKENVTIWLIHFSALQAHCPEVDSKAKAMENCRYTVVPIWHFVWLFFTLLFCKSAPWSRNSLKNV